MSSSASGGDATFIVDGTLESLTMSGPRARPSLRDRALLVGVALLAEPIAVAYPSEIG